MCATAKGSRSMPFILSIRSPVVRAHPSWAVAHAAARDDLAGHRRVAARLAIARSASLPGAARNRLARASTRTAAIRPALLALGLLILVVTALAPPPAGFGPAGLATLGVLSRRWRWVVHRDPARDRDRAAAVRRRCPPPAPGKLTPKSPRATMSPIIFLVPAARCWRWRDGEVRPAPSPRGRRAGARRHRARRLVFAFMGVTAFLLSMWSATRPDDADRGLDHDRPGEAPGSDAVLASPTPPGSAASAPDRQPDQCDRRRRDRAYPRREDRLPAVARGRHPAGAGPRSAGLVVLTRIAVRSHCPRSTGRSC